MSDPRLARAIERIDAANREDPTGEAETYGRRMTDWLERLAPDASDALRIAARAQHIRRWQIPRAEYPRTRAGYLKWRSALYDFHADQAEAILRGVGFGDDDDTIPRVRKMLRKKGMRDDSEVQTLEDVACLVFLEHYFAPFVAENDYDDEKLAGIVHKTWRKMSARAHEAALGVDLPERERAIVAMALRERESDRAT